MKEQNVWQYIKNWFKSAGILGKFIGANAIVFLLFLILNLVEKLFVIENLTLDVKMVFGVAPGNLELLLQKPWTIITQLFTHANFGHFALNMIAFYFIGKMFVGFLGGRRLATTYFLGGIFGYLMHVAAYYTFPVYANSDAPQLLGASGSVYALFAAVVAHKPNLKMRLLFLPKQPISLTLIFGLFILLDLIGLMKPDEESQTAYFAHLGGALFGFISVINVNSPKNFMNRFENFMRKFKWKGLFKRKPKMKIYSQEEVQNMDDDQYRTEKKTSQKRVDAILDKISKKGYEGLTKEEKEILFNESKRK
jgi:rhomboid family protein